MIKKILITLISCLLGLILFEFLYKNLKLDNVSEQYKELSKIYSLWTDKKKLVEELILRTRFGLMIKITSLTMIVCQNW